MKSVLLWMLGIAAFVAVIKYVGFSHAGSCSQLAESTKLDIREAQRCKADTDCTSVRLACPFDCTTPVNRIGVNRVLNAANTYARSCMMVCPECPKGVVPEAARCIAGYCAVSE